MTSADVQAQPAHVLRYFAHMDPAFAAELRRRDRVGQEETLRTTLNAEVSAVREMDRGDRDSWARIVDLILGPSMSRKLRAHGIPPSVLLEVAGVKPDGRFAQFAA